MKYEVILFLNQLEGKLKILNLICMQIMLITLSWTWMNNIVLS